MKQQRKARIRLLTICILLLLASVFVLLLREEEGLRRLVGSSVTQNPVLALLLRDSAEEDAALLAQSSDLTEPKTYYDLSEADRVVTLLVEVYGEAGDSLASFESPEKGEGLRLPALVQEGNESGTAKWLGFGYSAVSPNATIEVRGEPKLNRKYHNFKLRLQDSVGQFESQSILNLKKGYTKPCRVEEKFAFDLFASLPEMFSMKTAFVHLYVKDVSANDPCYMDYGLYTMVEQPDSYYFSNRSLDDTGNLYQAEDFRFSPERALLDATDPNYSKKDFEKILDIKTGDNHTDLLQMLEALNNPAVEIDTVVDTYFDRENLLSWLAMNVILANNDCVTHGYLLYRPSLSEKWYFLPGNMSDAMPAAGDPAVFSTIQTGLAMFYGNVLYERFLEKPENLEELEARIQSLLQYFDAQAVRSLTDQYINVLSVYLFQNPDIGTLRQTPDTVLGNVAAYRESMLQNVKAFHDTLRDPRKIELLDARREGKGTLSFSWTPSAQMDGSALRYRLEVSQTPDFTQVLATQETNRTELHLYGLPPGQLFWRVTVLDAAGRTAPALNSLRLSDDRVYYGLAMFYAAL